MGRFKKQSRKAAKSAVTVTHSRKEKRKEMRKQKKQMRHQHKYRSTNEEEAIVQENVQSCQTNKKAGSIGDSLREVTEKKLEKLRREQDKRRIQALQRANKEEEENLKKLEKQLGIKKSKSNVEKAFAADGLDFILEACKSEKGPEQDDESENSSMEEDHHDEDDGAEMEEDYEQEDGEAEDHNEMDDTEEETDKDETNAEKNETETSDVVPSGKYIPPALRAKTLGDDCEKRKEMLRRLENKIKGLLNRLATTNLGGIAKQMEEIYASHSRNDTNECLFRLYKNSLIVHVITPERLIMEHALLVSILFANVGTEVGATMLQFTVKHFDELLEECSDDEDEGDKRLDNALMLISHLYTFKVVDCLLLFDIVDRIVDRFSSKDVELALRLLKTVGFGLRKDDPAKLKEAIVKIQKKSQEAQEKVEDKRIKFMLETIMAIKNNNVKKIPQYDTEHQQFLLKNMKGWIRPGTSNFPLRVSLKDLLRTEEKGRWWIVGSAWAGKDSEELKEEKSKSFSSYSSDLLELAKKMRMNTDARKSIFCALMSAEDYLEAFERVLKLPVKHQKEREVTFVLVDCCLNETIFNPYYPQLASKFASFDRKYRIALQFSLWDKVKALHSLKKFQRTNLAHFTVFLIKNQCLSVACLKVIEFADLDVTYVSYLKKVLISLLEVDNDALKAIFNSIAGYPKLKLLREGLRLFMRQFLLKSEGDEQEDSKDNLEQKISVAESAMALS